MVNNGKKYDLLNVLTDQMSAKIQLHLPTLNYTISVPLTINHNYIGKIF